MTSYIARRLLYAIFVLWGAVTIIFIVIRIVPGDPAAVLLGPNATRDQLQNAREQLGLEAPLFTQYVSFLTDVWRLDFGDSFRLSQPAMSLVFSRLPATVLLASTAMAIAIAVSFPLGVAAALRSRRILDRVISTLSLFGQSLPTFWVGIMLILVFARTFTMLPSGGNATLAHLILPAVTLSLPFLSILVRLIRAGLLEVLSEGYIQTARAKGLSGYVVLNHHAVRNMLIPVVTVVGLQFGAILGGTVIVETVFTWPGVGRLLVDAISDRDYTVVQSCTFLIAAIFVLMNLVVDVTYGYLDPRIRVGEDR